MMTHQVWMPHDPPAHFTYSCSLCLLVVLAAWATTQGFQRLSGRCTAHRTSRLRCSERGATCSGKGRTRVTRSSMGSKFKSSLCLGTGHNLESVDKIICKQVGRSRQHFVHKCGPVFAHGFAWCWCAPNKISTVLSLQPATTSTSHVHIKTNDDSLRCLCLFISLSIPMGT